MKKIIVTGIIFCSLAVATFAIHTEPSPPKYLIVNTK